ncbi:MAG: methylmalonyl-CoA epimerase [Planctomycetes bacterium]|nr:methylmalonyl-CoA epimerase [Planctomycetota bacterium]
MQPPSQIDHIGIAVRSIEQAVGLYRDVLSLPFEGLEEVEDQKVKVAFFTVGQVRVELLEPTDADSPIAEFLDQRGPGLHHVAYRVDDLAATLAALKAAGIRLIDESPRDGAHGMKIAFAHPKSTGGVLTEFCQAAD